MMILWFIVIALSCNGSGSSNVTNRALPLVFSNGGQIVIVVGFLSPLDIPQWQGITCINNLRAQYGVPVEWSQYLSSFKGRHRRGPDSSRQVAYGMFEGVMNRWGWNGRACNLRAICELAAHPLRHDGLVGELIQLFFTPGIHERLDADYKYAWQAGKFGTHCASTFPLCNHGLLDLMSVLL